MRSVAEVAFRWWSGCCRVGGARSNAMRSAAGVLRQPTFFWLVRQPEAESPTEYLGQLRRQREPSSDGRIKTLSARSRRPRPPPPPPQTTRRPWQALGSPNRRWGSGGNFRLGEAETPESNCRPRRETCKSANFSRFRLNAASAEEAKLMAQRFGRVGSANASATAQLVVVQAM